MRSDKQPWGWCSVGWKSPGDPGEGKEGPAIESPQMHVWLGLGFLTESFMWKNAVLPEVEVLFWKIKLGFDEKFTPGKGFLWRWRIKVHLLTKEEETRLIKPLGGSGSSAGGRHTLEQELELSLPTATACSLESRQAFPRAMSFTPT